MKLLTLPENTKELLRAALLQQVDEVLNKSVDKAVTIKADVQALLLHNVADKATICFSTDAWNKLWYLTHSSTQEVAAHCLVTRDPTQPNNFLVYDTLMYPQTVSSATVQATDDYGPWLMSLPESDFNDCKLQMHSHVNMGVTPSGVDTAFYQTLLPQIKDFYIFMIMNKRSELWLNIYDKANNILYETNDIEYDILDSEGNSIIDWFDTGCELIEKPKPYTPPATTYQDYDWAKDYRRTPQRLDTPPPKQEEKRKPGRPPKISKQERELMNAFDKEYFNAIHD